MQSDFTGGSSPCPRVLCVVEDLPDRDEGRRHLGRSVHSDLVGAGHRFFERNHVVSARFAKQKSREPKKHCTGIELGSISHRRPPDAGRLRLIRPHDSPIRKPETHRSRGGRNDNIEEAEALRGLHGELGCRRAGAGGNRSGFDEAPHRRHGRRIAINISAEADLGGSRSRSRRGRELESVITPRGRLEEVNGDEAPAIVRANRGFEPAFVPSEPGSRGILFVDSLATGNDQEGANPVGARPKLKAIPLSWGRPE